jgi:hypothetical protein
MMSDGFVNTFAPGFLHFTPVFKRDLFGKMEKSCQPFKGWQPYTPAALPHLPFRYSYLRLTQSSYTITY